MTAHNSDYNPSHAAAISSLTSSRKERLLGLDGLRAIAVFLVLLGHFCPPHATGTFFDGVIARGGFGVEIFFVLSGFLITHLLLKEEQTIGIISLPLFYARRTLRILPPLMFYCFILWGLSRTGIVAVPESDLMAGLLFVRNFFGSSPETTHLWTLAIEEQFYILWPLFLLLLASRTKRIIGCTLLVCLLPIWRQLNYILAGGAMHANSWRTDLRVEPMVIGALLALLLTSSKAKKVLTASRLTHGFVALVSVAIIWMMQFTPIGAFPGVRFIAPTLSSVCVALIINCSVNRPQSYQNQFLELRPLAYIGQLSYSVYLWQQLFSPHVTGAENTWFREFPINLAFTISLALFSYYGIERSLFSLRRRLRPH